MSRSFDLPEVEWATVGTVGEPGHRTFYLQARQAGELVTLKLEKQQVAALAQFVGEILSDLPDADSVPEGDLELSEPLSAEWAVGSIQLAYDSDADRILLVAEEAVLEEAGDDPDDPVLQAAIASADPAKEPPDEHGVARLGLSRSQAAALVRKGWDLVQAGRPTCPLCGNPMDPEGHSCPRTNGHRPPET